MSRETVATLEPRRGGQPADEAYLKGIGERVRRFRAGRGMTRKMLARASGVSERYLADLEQGTGNASVLVLRQVADAMAVSVAALVSESADGSGVQAAALAALERLGPDDIAAALRLIEERFPMAKRPEGRIALIGLRGAGKSTVGAGVAQRLGRPFVVLAREIEAAAGRPIADVIASDGQAAYRRLELDTLHAILRRHETAVIDAGGGIVTEPAAYGLLRASCVVVWLKAEPQTYMRRVVDQGDTRPMADTPAAMDDLIAILESRARLHALADLAIDTTHLSVAQAIDAVVDLAAPELSRA
jgi:XRE family transcriptional regulator, aerobic/anaerobic benzoate catabolism transcriptional regulator